MGELEDKVKDLEQKVADLFMDNAALKTKLEASREVERKQHEENAHLKERLVQALKAQVKAHFQKLYCVSLLSTYSCAQQYTATQEQLLSRTRESELEEKIKLLVEARSDLEAEVEKLEKQMKQVEILPSDIEKLAKVHIHVPCS